MDSIDPKLITCMSVQKLVNKNIYLMNFSYIRLSFSMASVPVSVVKSSTWQTVLTRTRHSLGKADSSEPHLMFAVRAVTTVLDVAWSVEGHWIAGIGEDVASSI